MAERLPIIFFLPSGMGRRPLLTGALGKATNEFE